MELDLKPPFRILCTSKESFEKAMLILLSNNFTWRSGSSNIKPPGFSFDFDKNNIILFCKSKKSLTYVDSSKTITNFNNPIMTLSELELLDKKF